MSSIETKSFHCPDCGKEFSKEKKLLSHFKVHSTRKIYECEVCTLKFSEKSLYKKHIKLHFEKGTCSCPKCGKVFVRHSWLKRHLNQQCNDTYQSCRHKFVCRDCGKMYDSLAGARGHLRKGKHMEPVFLCHSCKLICSCSEALFFHVLQHNDINLIIVGVDKNQQVECFSTLKIREKVDISSLRPDSTSEDSQDTDKALTQSILGADELENLTYQNENVESQDIMQSSKVSSQEETSPEKVNIQCQPETLEETYIEQKDEVNHTSKNDAKTIMLYQENEVPYDLLSPIDSLKPIILQDGITNESASTPSECANITNEFTSITNECGSITSECTSITDECINPSNNSIAEDNCVFATQKIQENLYMNGDRMTKKMPKLLNLYPEEEHSTVDNASSMRDNTTLQSEAVMQQNMMGNTFQTEPLITNHNEITPYTAPLVNTMFLPPLFLIHNTLPMNMNPNLTPQNTFQMGETFISNHPIPNNTSAATIMNELKNMTEEIAVPRKKKKRNLRVGKKCPDNFQRVKNGNNSTLTKQQNNACQLPLQNFALNADNVIMHPTANSSPSNPISVSPQENRIQKLEDLVNLTEQMNGANKNISIRENSTNHDTRNLQGKNQSHNVFWEILVGSDESDGKIVSSISSNFKNQSNIQNKEQKLKPSQKFCNNVALPEKQESTIPACDIPSIRYQQQQHRSKEGIEVEDYIKKFMWL